MAIQGPQWNTLFESQSQQEIYHYRRSSRLWAYSIGWLILLLVWVSFACLPIANAGSDDDIFQDMPLMDNISPTNFTTPTGPTTPFNSPPICKHLSPNNACIPTVDERPPLGLDHLVSDEEGYVYDPPYRIPGLTQKEFEETWFGVPNTIRIGVLLPFTINPRSGYMTPLSRISLSVLRMAIRDMNNKQVIPGMNISLVVRDSQQHIPGTNVSGGAAAISATTRVLALDVGGVIGDIDSDLTTAEAIMTSSVGTPQCSFASYNMDPTLLANFVYLFRTVPGVSRYIEALALVVKYYKWRTVSIMHTSDIPGILGEKAFSALCATYGIDVVRFPIPLPLGQDILETANSVIKNLKNSDTRIHVLVASRPHQIPLLIALRDIGLFHSDHVWMTSIDLSDSITQLPNPTDFNGLIMSDALWNMPGVPEYDQFVTEWQSLNPEEYPLSGSSMLTWHETATYTCVQVLAEAYKGLVESAMELTNATAREELLQEIRHGRRSQDITLKYLSSKIFNTPVGKFQISPGGEAFRSPISISSFQNNFSVPHGKVVAQKLSMFHNIVFNDGSTNPPSDAPKWEEPSPDIQTVFGIFVMILTTLLVLSILATAIIVIIFRENIVIKSARSTIVYNLSDGASVINHAVSNRYLLRVVTIIVTITSIPSIVKCFVRYPVPTLIRTNENEYWVSCVSPNMSPAWDIAAFAMPIMINIFGMYLAFKTRNVARLWNEARSIAITIYLVMFFVIIIIIVQTFPNTLYEVSYYATLMSVFAASLSEYIILFIPKLRNLWLQRRGFHVAAGRDDDRLGNIIGNVNPNVGGNGGRLSGATLLDDGSGSGSGSGRGSGRGIGGGGGSGGFKKFGAKSRLGGSSVAAPGEPAQESIESTGIHQNPNISDLVSSYPFGQLNGDSNAPPLCSPKQHSNTYEHSSTLVREGGRSNGIFNRSGGDIDPNASKEIPIADTERAISPTKLYDIFARDHSADTRHNRKTQSLGSYTVIAPVQRQRWYVMQFLAQWRMSKIIFVPISKLLVIVDLESERSESLIVHAIEKGYSAIDSWTTTEKARNINTTIYPPDISGSQLIPGKDKMTLETSSLKQPDPHRQMQQPMRRSMSLPLSRRTSEPGAESSVIAGRGEGERGRGNGGEGSAKEFNQVRSAASSALQQSQKFDEQYQQEDSWGVLRNINNKLPLAGSGLPCQVSEDTVLGPLDDGTPLNITQQNLHPSDNGKVLVYLAMDMPTGDGSATNIRAGALPDATRPQIVFEPRRGRDEEEGEPANTFRHQIESVSGFNNGVRRLSQFLSSPFSRHSLDPPNPNYNGTKDRENNIDDSQQEYLGVEQGVISEHIIRVISIHNEVWRIQLPDAEIMERWIEIGQQIKDENWICRPHMMKEYPEDIQGKRNSSGSNQGRAKSNRSNDNGLASDVQNRSSNLNETSPNNKDSFTLRPPRRILQMPQRSSFHPLQPIPSDLQSGRQTPEDPLQTTTLTNKNLSSVVKQRLSIPRFDSDITETSGTCSSQNSERKQIREQAARINQELRSNTRYIPPLFRSRLKELTPSSSVTNSPHFGGGDDFQSVDASPGPSLVETYRRKIPSSLSMAPITTTTREKGSSGGNRQHSTVSDHQKTFSSAPAIFNPLSHPDQNSISYFALTSYPIVSPKEPLAPTVEATPLGGDRPSEETSIRDILAEQNIWYDQGQHAVYEDPMPGHEHRGYRHFNTLQYNYDRHRNSKSSSFNRRRRRSKLSDDSNDLDFELELDLDMDFENMRMRNLGSDFVRGSESTPGSPQWHLTSVELEKLEAENLKRYSNGGSNTGNNNKINNFYNNNPIATTSFSRPPENEAKQSGSTALASKDNLWLTKSDEKNSTDTIHRATTIPQSTLPQESQASMATTTTTVPSTTTSTATILPEGNGSTSAFESSLQGDTRFLRVSPGVPAVSFGTLSSMSTSTLAQQQQVNEDKEYPWQQESLSLTPIIIGSPASSEQQGLDDHHLDSTITQENSPANDIGLVAFEAIQNQEADNGNNDSMDALHNNPDEEERGRKGDDPRVLSTLVALKLCSSLTPANTRHSTSDFTESLRDVSTTIDKVDDGSRSPTLSIQPPQATSQRSQPQQ
ncbi:hypothetical protein FBU30_003213 [Linnemannia zychae]|nr:hypothetical protein FBU30_003213 [Linnemannia zychae]